MGILNYLFGRDTPVIVERQEAPSIVEAPLIAEEVKENPHIPEKVEKPKVKPRLTAKVAAARKAAKKVSRKKR